MKKCVSLSFLLLFLLMSSQAQQLRYVAANQVGNGDGLSAANAADFLSSTFWPKVQQLLSKSPVTVKFLSGNYSRAYTEKFLSMDGMGNEKNLLTLEGDPVNTVFSLPEGTIVKSQVIKVTNAVNITLKNFKFTGNGPANYVLNITTDAGKTTSRITIENCSWEDMKGVVYGATGATKEGTHHITFKNCTFKRIGKNAGSHMIYNAYSSHHISIIDSYFEDCTGDYIRFRDRCDYGVVKGTTFHQKAPVGGIKFISMPLYNDGKPSIGNEAFATHYAFTNNTFISDVPGLKSVQFSNSGYSAVGYNYLLTPEEGEVLNKGKEEEQRKLLLNNFGITAAEVRIHNNTYKGVTSDVFLRSVAGYGATAKGWQGDGNITQIINKSAVPFTWERETASAKR
jgi:hypothetical protein